LKVLVETSGNFPEVSREISSGFQKWKFPNASVGKFPPTEISGKFWKFPREISSEISPLLKCDLECEFHPMSEVSREISSGFQKWKFHNATKIQFVFSEPNPVIQAVKCYSLLAWSNA